MRIVKYTHSCVRLEHDGSALVIDPGIWSEPRALLGVDAVLISHEHVDHVDVLRLKGLGDVEIYAPAGADVGDLDVIRLHPGEVFAAAGFHITAVGGKHAAVYEQLPDCANLGYLIEASVYHPGDSLHVPEQAVETLLVPVQASWVKTSEVLDFVRAVRPERAFGIHDAQLNERGLSSVNAWLSEESRCAYKWLAPGEEG